MGRDLAGDVGRHIGHAGHALGCSNQRLAQRRDLTFGGVAQFHVKRHVSARDLQVFEAFGGNEIFARVRIDHGLQGLQELFGGRHRCLSLLSEVGQEFTDKRTGRP